MSPSESFSRTRLGGFGLVESRIIVCASSTEIIDSPSPPPPPPPRGSNPFPRGSSPFRNFNPTALLNFPARQHPGKNPFGRENTVPHLIVNGARGVADLSDLGDLNQGLLANLKPGAHRNFQKIDSVGGDILRKIARNP